MNTQLVAFLFFLLVISFEKNFASAASPSSYDVDKELILTEKEKIAFETFRAAIIPELKLEMMKNDLYLLRWIRAKRLDVKLAVRDMLEVVEFIRVNHIATIMDEDFGDMIDEVPYNQDIVDLKGRPVGYGSFDGAWNIRRIVLQGRRPQLNRYLYKMTFGLMFKLADINKKQPNITTFSVLVSFNGFNSAQHVCPLCVSTYVTLLQLYERFLPGFVEQVIVINAPTSIHVFLNVIRPVLSEHTNRALKIFGQNKNVWKPYLDARFDPNKLPEGFGGNILDSSAVVSASNDVVDKELILTEKEKIAFAKFRAAIMPNLTIDMMKHDIFLLRWIRAKNLNVERAKRDMLEMVKFVREKNITNIMNEDFSDINDDFPYHMDIVDLKGRPVGYGSTEGAWNIRRTILQGKQAQLTRYVYRMVFGIMFKLLEINKTQPNITKFSVIVSFDGFNLVQHGCPLCLSTYITLLNLYENYLPGCSEEILVINAPTSINLLINMLRPFFSEYTNRALKIFGPNKNAWKPYLDARFDPDKLPELFGGNILDR
ncbi:unnamed protein product [Orchesella dallaii]|uniref:CRAL-TRIO domain-containing protein n=1 Tax=Orchesella dallaii TaxID=48710 RepID=A0ABP1PZE8_9HEXA